MFISQRADERYEVRRHGDFSRYKENFQLIGTGEDGKAVDTLLMIAENLDPERIGEGHHHIDEFQRNIFQGLLYRCPVFFCKKEEGFLLIGGAEDIVDDGTGEVIDEHRFLSGVLFAQVFFEPFEKYHLDNSDALSQDRHQSAFEIVHHDSSVFAAPLSPIPPSFVKRKSALSKIAGYFHPEKL